MKVYILSFTIILLNINFSYDVNCQIMNNMVTSYGLDAGEDGTESVYFGYAAGRVDTMGSNTIVGHEAGSNNISGLSNTFLGFKTGLLNSSGKFNTFLGYGSGLGNIHGSRNTYIGLQSGSHIRGSNNIALGYQAGLVGSTSNKLFIDVQRSTRHFSYMSQL